MGKRKEKPREKGFQEPTMPSRTGYVTFLQDQMGLVEKKLANSRKYIRKVDQMWHDLPSEEKEIYQEKMKQNMKKYSQELQEWFKILTPAKQKRFLRCNPNKKQYLVVTDTESHPKHRTSDSEDENIESSSSDEVDFSEGEELEGDGQGDMFKMY